VFENLKEWGCIEDRVFTDKQYKDMVYGAAPIICRTRINQPLMSKYKFQETNFQEYRTATKCKRHLQPLYSFEEKNKYFDYVDSSNQYNTAAGEGYQRQALSYTVTLVPHKKFGHSW
jgi:hypothetical protein